MNIQKLKQAEINFLENFPGGFSNPVMKEIAKKHKGEKMNQLAYNAFQKECFKDTQAIMDNMVKIITLSSMISIFEKPKFKDFAKLISLGEKTFLVNGLYNFLYGDEEEGFSQMVQVLAQEKMAKWSVLTVLFVYFRPQWDVFVKPTTVKGILAYMEIEEIKYSPKPTYAFYKRYRELLNEMKTYVDVSLSPDNAAFSGFLMSVI